MINAIRFERNYLSATTKPTERRIQEIERFLSGYGFKIKPISDGIEAVRGNIVVKFRCDNHGNNAHQTFRVYRNGERATIKSLFDVIAIIERI